jgi:hypothetical protein
MSKWSRDVLLSWILAGIAGFLALLVVVEWVVLDGNRQDLLGSIASKPGATRSDEAAEEKDGKDFELPELDEYEQITARPLFSESRRPAEEATANAETQSELPKSPLTLKLMGIVFTPTTQTALLVDAKGKYKRVKLQETFDNWTLVELTAEAATLQQGEEKQKLDLLKLKPKAPKPLGAPGQAGPIPPRPGMAGAPGQIRPAGRQVQRPQPEEMDESDEEDQSEDQEDTENMDEEDSEESTDGEEP